MLAKRLFAGLPQLNNFRRRSPGFQLPADFVGAADFVEHLEILFALRRLNEQVASARLFDGVEQIKVYSDQGRASRVVDLQQDTLQPLPFVGHAERRKPDAAQTVAVHRRTESVRVEPGCDDAFERSFQSCADARPTAAGQFSEQPGGRVVKRRIAAWHIGRSRRPPQTCVAPSHRTPPAVHRDDREFAAFPDPALAVDHLREFAAGHAVSVRNVPLPDERA